MTDKMSTDVANTEQQLESHLKSPFQLNKEKPLTIISLPQNNALSTNGANISPTSSISSESSETMSPKSLINSNPFSLQVKRLGSLSSTVSSSSMPSSPPFLLSTSLSKEGLTPEQKITEMQKEITLLKKDIEAKDAKLSSSLKSIKQFWSPELKKERAARKEESERYVLLKEKDQISNSQIEEYRRTLQDLESELKSQQQEINLLTKKLQETNNTSTANELYKEEIENLQRNSSAKDDEMFILNKTLDDFENKCKLLEEELNEKNKCISDLEITLVAQGRHQQEHEDEKKEFDVLSSTVSSRESEYQQLQKQHIECQEELTALKKKLEKQQKLSDELQAAVKEKDARIINYKSDLTKYEQESADLKTQCEEVERKVKSEEGQLRIYEKEIADLKGVISELESTLTKQEQLYESTKVDVEKLRKKDEDSTDRISELEDLFLSKDKEYDKLQLELKTLQEKIDEYETVEVRQRKSSTPAEIEWLKDVLQSKENELNTAQKKAITMRGKLHDAEKTSNELEQELKRLKSEDSHALLAASQKEKEVADLTIKYENLDKYLSERETALENCREELKELKGKNSNLTIVKDQLENQLYEQKSLIHRLEKQKERFSKTKEEAVSVNAFNEVKAQLDELTKKYEELVEATHENQTVQSELEGKLSEKTEALKLAEEKYERECEKIKELEGEVKQLQAEKTDLSKEMVELKQRSTDSEKQRNRTASEGRVKDNKSTKNLWDELSKKEAKIDELEKQVKEKTRQFLALKKTQSAEKKEQHDMVNDAIKIETGEQFQKMEEELEKKEKRVTMLEDALRESVSIAAEREDILARHLEMSEDAAKKVEDTEGEYDRIVVEKAITNIKNAYLILSLSERDALIASMKAARKRRIEELLNMKQEGLLTSISEKDTQIAHLELQSSKIKRPEIAKLKSEKEKFVNELKEQNNVRMTMLNNEGNKENLIIHELKDAPGEQVYEAIRHLLNSSNKLEFYIDELMAFLREKNVELLKDVPNLPRKKARPIDKLKKASKEELMKELNFVEGDSLKLKQYVEKLLDKLEGPP